MSVESSDNQRCDDMNKAQMLEFVMMVVMVDGSRGW